MFKLLMMMFISVSYANPSVDDILSVSRQVIEGAPKSCRSAFAESDVKHTLNRSKQLFIFVSSSLSDSVLRGLFQDASKIGAKLIFRGLINNSFKETYEYFKHIQINADIDPTQFEKHSVSVVPTFVLTDAKEKTVDRLQGNVSLAEALTQFKDRGDLKDLAVGYIKALGDRL